MSNFIDDMPNADKEGLNAGVNLQNLSVLKGTGIGIGKKNKGKDKSTYTVTTKPDGTVVEEVKMNKKINDKGLLDVKTDGVNLDGVGVKAGVSPNVSEDIVGFVDSIWGSKQAAGITAQKRADQAKNTKSTVPHENNVAEFQKARAEALEIKNEKLKEEQEENIRKMA